MPFITVHKLRTAPVSPTEPQVTMGSYLADGKKHKTKSVNLRFSASLIEQVGWKVEDKILLIVLNEGVDADKGLLQIVNDAVHPQRRKTTQGEGRQGFAISLGIDSFKHYVLNECPVPTQVVSHIIDGEAIIIECPDWLRYNPESVPQPEQKQLPLVAAPPAPVQLHPGRGHRRRG